jgi:protein-tyrosine phosphatase
MNRPGADPEAPADGSPELTVLFVCTGNICRSPLAERLGRHLVTAQGAAGAGVQLVSAGTQAVVGRGMDPASARVLQERGGSPTGFRARQLTGPMAVEADLTLTMTRRHRQEVLARAPRALSRTFTLSEAAGLLALVPAGPVPGDTPGERARALIRQMAAARSRRPSGPDDDILDPIGRPDVVHDQVGQAIADAVQPVLHRLLSVVAGQVVDVH